ncbi:GRAP1 protein, partial [Amia calva]|nr:GRAP1 protein [Amia calva]
MCEPTVSSGPVPRQGPSPVPVAHPCPVCLWQEVDALLSENEMLQGKLHSQEDDFRLQNSTLMQELSKLCSQIEQLEQDNQRLREGQGAAPTVASPGPAPVDRELLRLQAENSALQKNMAALQERYDQEVQSQRGAAVNGHKASVSDGQTDTDGCVVSSEAELQLHTEQEEKRLLKEQLQTLESAKQTDLSKLQEELAKLSDKLKKKQESFLRLQAEKEALYNDSRTKIDEIQQRKEEELKSMTIRNQKLQGDLLSSSQSIAELKEQMQSQQKEHEMALHALRDQVACQSAVSQEQVESILTENDALRTNLAALEQIQTAKTQEMNILRDQNVALTMELQQRQADQDNFLAQKDDLNSQLQEANRANNRVLEQLAELGQEKEKVQQELEEMRKTADKRKAMLDEMAIEMAQEKSRHKEDLGNVRLQHEKEVLGIRAKYERELRELHEEKNRTEDEIRAQLRDERARTKDLEGLQQTVEELQAQIQSMEGTKGWFERRLKEAEETIEKNALERQEHIEKLQAEHAVQLQVSRLSCVPPFGAFFTPKTEHVAGYRDSYGSVCLPFPSQEIKDTVDGQRILEKKGSSALKDLKRQLHLERKRADKLQERLQEILTNTKTRPEAVDTGRSHTWAETQRHPCGDTSLSLRPCSHFLSPSLPVKHLEVSCSSMADDICKKSAIIETYVMDSRRGELSLSLSV